MRAASPLPKLRPTLATFRCLLGSPHGGGGNTALRWPENSLIMEAGAPALSCLRQHTCNSNGSSPRRPKTKFILHHFWFELLTKPHPWGLVKWLIRGKGGVDPPPTTRKVAGMLLQPGCWGRHPLVLKSGLAKMHGFQIGATVFFHSIPL